MENQDILATKKLLIVDDEPDILATLKDLLPMCQITEATSFEEAKAKLDTQAFDLIILDIMGVDGYQLLELAVDRGALAVMLTAYAVSPEDVVRSYKKGAAHFIPKDEMAAIATYLVDIFKAKREGRSLWGRWLERLNSYMEKRFGPDWKKKDHNFWDNFPFYQ